MSLVPSNLVDVFGLLLYDEFPMCQVAAALVHHTLKRAMNPEALLYKVSQQFRTQDYEEVTGTTPPAGNVAHLGRSYCSGIRSFSAVPTSEQEFAISNKS